MIIARAVSKWEEGNCTCPISTQCVYVCNLQFTILATEDHPRSDEATVEVDGVGVLDVCNNSLAVQLECVCAPHEVYMHLVLCMH